MAGPCTSLRPRVKYVDKRLLAGMNDQRRVLFLTSKEVTSGEVLSTLRSMDQIDRIIAEWQHSQPSLDTTPLAVLGRIARLMGYFEQVRDSVLAQHQLKYGEFDVLLTLRRQGEPYTLSPSQLSQSLLLTSGGISKRIDKLENAGLVERLPDDADRRGVMIRLSDSGLAKVNQALTPHTDAQLDLLAHLPACDQQALATLLQRWLVALENT